MSTRFRYCGELLSNPGFETSGTGGADVFGSWTEATGDGAIASETSLIHGGTKAAKLTAGASSNTTLQQAVVVVPGYHYVLTFYTRGDETYDGKYQVYDVTNSANIVATVDTGVTGATYTLVTVAFTAPAGCVSARITLGCPVENGGIAYFDDVSVLPADFTWDADVERGEEPIGRDWMDIGGGLHFDAATATGVRPATRVSAKGVDPYERDMLYAAYKAARLADCTWRAWDQTADSLVRTVRESWKETAQHRADGTAVYNVSFAIQENT